MHMDVCAIDRYIDTTNMHRYSVCLQCHSPLRSVEYATGSLRPELKRAGGEEEEQLLHHGADVGGRHERQGEVQRPA